MSRTTRSMATNGGGSPEDIQALLAMMAKTLEAVTNQTKSSSYQTSHQSSQQQNVKLENCPVKRANFSLEAWIEEVKLWDNCNVADDESLRAKKYLKFVDSVRKSENCTDIQNLVEVEFVENQQFDKKAEDVITTIVTKIQEKLGKTDIEKCSNAWLDFINIKQKPDECASDFVTRFENIESQLRNVKIIIPAKALAIHLMNKTNMEQQSKENVLTKTDLDNEAEIYTSMKQSIRQMKGKLTASETNKEELKTFYEGFQSKDEFIAFYENGGRSRSKSRMNYRPKISGSKDRRYRSDRSLSRGRPVFSRKSRDNSRSNRYNNEYRKYHSDQNYRH